MKKYLLILAVLSVSMISGDSLGIDKQEIRVGVLANRGERKSVDEWQPTIDYLNQSLPKYKFVLVSVGFSDLSKTIESEKINFIITNPAFYVQLEVSSDVMRIMTMKKKGVYGWRTFFGGIIFTKAGRDDINSLHDIKGMTFAAVDPNSFGGWLAALREFKAAGVNPYKDFKKLEFAGSHDKVLEEVLSGNCDAGTVNTDIFEHLILEGKIDISGIKLINDRSGIEQYDIKKIPKYFSTRLYPEWPFSKTRITPDEIGEDVVTALLNMPENHPAVQAAGDTAWGLTQNYQPVHECLKELELEPYKSLQHYMVRNFLREHLIYIIVITVLLAVSVAVALITLTLSIKLLQAKEEWARTFDAVTDFLFIQDNNYKIIQVNKACADILKMRKGDIVGRKCYEVMHGMEKPWPSCPYHKTTLDKAAHTEEVDDPKLGLPLLVSTSPIFDKKGKFIGSVHLAKDISRQKNVERALREAVEIKSKFVSTVSHELRTPLTAIKEGITIVLDGTAGPTNTQQEEFLTIAKRNVDRLARLVNDILDFQKIQFGKFEFVFKEGNINDMIRDVFITMEPVFSEKGLDLRCELAEKLPDVRYDKDRITQVLTNLVNNAFKFTEKGKVILRSYIDGNCVGVSVSDTGPGIPANDMERLFTSFSQLDNVRDKKGSSGLGLAISKEIIEKHRGKIWVESEPGKGSTFSFLLPIKERRADGQ